METFRRAHDHKGAAVRRDLPELQRLQRRRLRDGHRQGGPRPTCSSRSRTASRSASAPTASKGVVARRPGPGRASSTWPTSARTRILVHDEARDDPGLAFALSRLARGPDRADARSACSGPSTGPSTAPRPTASSPPPSAQRGPGDLAALLRSAPPGTSAADAARPGTSCGHAPRSRVGSVARRRGRRGRSGAWARRTSSSAACARRRRRWPRSGRRSPGRSSTPASASPVAPRPRARCRRRAGRRARARGARRGPRRGGRCRGRARRPGASGRGRRSSASRSGSTRPRRAGVAHGRVTATPSGGPPADLEPRLEGGGEVEAVGQAGRAGGGWAAR